MHPRLKTLFGEKLGRYAFAPLRILTYTDKGVKRWASPRSAFRPERGTGFAARNQGEASVTYEEVPLGTGELIVVTHAWETMAARIRINHPGSYGICVRFLAITWAAPFECRVAANGRTLGQGSLDSPDAKFEWNAVLKMNSEDFIDLEVNALPEEEGPPCRVILEFALLHYDGVNRDALQRVDDGCSGMTDETARRLLQAQSGAEQSIEPFFVESPERESVLTETWTIDPGSIQTQFKSQFARSKTEFIRDVAASSSPPTKKYALLMVPRSGSTMLTELLASTGCLGYPVEYFVPDIVRCFSMAFMDRFTSYEDLLLRGMQTPNGTFGIEIEAERFLEERNFFADAQSWRFVHLRRDDVLSQAISLATAIQTGIWHRYSSTPAGPALLSRETILSKVNSLLTHEKIFAQFFAEHSVVPLNMTYEDLTAQPATEVARIAEFIGITDIDISRVEAHEVSMKRTAGDANQVYCAMSVLSGGAFYGYNLLEREEGFVALLAGVDHAQMGHWQERPPLIFADTDAVRLKDRVEEYVLGALQRCLRAELRPVNAPSGQGIRSLPGQVKKVFSRLRP